MRLGTYWLVRIGIVMLLTALVFFGNYAYQNLIVRLGPGGKVGLLYFASALLLGGLALGSRWPQGAEADHALLRLGWRLAGQVKERSVTQGQYLKVQTPVMTLVETTGSVVALFHQNELHQVAPGNEAEFALESFAPKYAARGDVLGIARIVESAEEQAATATGETPAAPPSV